MEYITMTLPIVKVCEDCLSCAPDAPAIIKAVGDIQIEVPYNEEEDGAIYFGMTESELGVDAVVKVVERLAKNAPDIIVDRTFTLQELAICVMSEAQYWYTHLAPQQAAQHFDDRCRSMSHDD